MLDESEYDFDPEDGDEFEESEVTAEPEFAGEEEGEDSGQPRELSDGGRAELRAPGANAGYQQRPSARIPIAAGVTVVGAVVDGLPCARAEKLRARCR